MPGITVQGWVDRPQAFPSTTVPYGSPFSVWVPVGYTNGATADLTGTGSSLMIRLPGGATVVTVPGVLKGQRHEFVLDTPEYVQLPLGQYSIEVWVSGLFGGDPICVVTAGIWTIAGSTLSQPAAQPAGAGYGFWGVYEDGNLYSTNVVLNGQDGRGVVLMDASGGPRTITLPKASTVAKRKYRFKKMDASANPVTLLPFAGDQIEFAAQQALVLQGSVVEVWSDGGTHWVFSG